MRMNMARTFQCQFCGKDIVVRYLRTGETAKCPHCGGYTTVPNEAIKTESSREGAAKETVGATSSGEHQSEAVSNPLIGIWFNPRQAVRLALAGDRQIEAYVFAGIYGIVHNLNLLQRYGVTAESGIPLWGIIAANVISGSIFGASILVLLSLVVSLASKLLGGTSSVRNARIALGWSCLPYTILLIIIPLILSDPGTFVYHLKMQIPSSAVAGIYTLLRGLIEIWSLIIMVVSTSEALGLSTKRAVLALIAPVILFTLITLLFVFTYSQVIH
jgi:hypothetical protein